MPYFYLSPFLLPLFFSLNLDPQFLYCKLFSLNIYIVTITLAPHFSPLPAAGCEAGLLTSCTDTHDERHSSTSPHSTSTQNRPTSPTTFSKTNFCLLLQVHSLNSGCYNKMLWTGWLKQCIFISHNSEG